MITASTEVVGTSNYVSIQGAKDTWIRDGAFTRTLRESFPKGKIKVFWWNREPMGLPRHMEEDSKGLFTVLINSIRQEQKKNI
jgi:hypothetical protein